MLKALLALLALSALGLSASAQTPSPSSFTDKELAQGFRDGYVLAKPRADHMATVDAAETGEGMTIQKKFDRFGGLRVLRLRAGETTQAAVARLAATGRYDFVEPDSIKHASAVPTDADFPQQWALNNTGSNGPASGIAGADIHAELAWNTRTDASVDSNGKAIVIAVVDSGAQLTHPGLQPNLWVNPQENSDGYTGDLNGINVSGNGASTGNPNDDDGHGTHVSGIIGAINTGNFTSGVAWKAQIMELKFLDASGGGATSSEIICLDFAYSHGASIVNASFGSTTYSSSEYTAIQTLLNAGIIFVAAAGNNADNNDLSPAYPASYPLDNIITVACSDNRDDSVFFTSYGSGIVDLYAPGYDILSLYPTNTTNILSGTSMSTPTVTGALALLKAQFPSDTYRQLINRVLNNVDVNTNFLGKVQTGGRLDLASAITSAPTDHNPFNDNFASRAHLSGTTVTVRSNNVGASRESDEPTISGNAGGASLWWDWTAPVTGSVTLTTAGSAYPTLLGVYTGTAVTALTPVVSNSSPGNGATLVTFTAQAGTTYEITVDGQNSGSGAVTGLTLLNISYANDSFATPITLSGSSVGITGSNGTATRQTGEPRIPGDTNPTGIGHSVWYAWTAPKNAQFQVSAFSFDFDPLLAVYTGASITSLSLAASNVGGAINSGADAPASQCTCTFTATAGTTYYIAVDGNTDNDKGLNAGQFTLSIADSRWQAVTGDAITCSPTVGTDGTIYVGSNDDYFYAYNPNGSVKWSFNSLYLLDTSAASLSSDGTAVYIGTYNGKIYALSTATGSSLWSYTTVGSSPLACAPTVGSDGTIYIKDEGNNLYALTSGGTLKWTSTIPGISYAAPVIGPDGTIYLGSDNTSFYAIKPADGTFKWIYNPVAPDVPGSIYTSAAIDAAGNIYFGTLGGTLFALNSSGQRLWSYVTGNSITSSPALNTVGGQQYVCFGGYDHHLYSINTTSGALQWAYTLPDEVRASSPVIDGNGVIYVGCYDNNVYAVNPGGTLNRIYATGDWVRSSPVIFGTTLYFGSNDHKLYAFDIGEGSAGSAWPMFLYNSRRLGRAVTDPLAISAEPAASTTLTLSAPMTLTVAATGQGPLAFQWDLNGSPISGATNSTYFVPSASSANYGTYTVIVSDPTQGTVTSTADTVANPSAPVFTLQPESQTMLPGTSVAFNAAATQSPTYQWYFNGTAIAGATSSPYFIKGATAANAGTYTCVATSGSFSITSSAATLSFATTSLPGYLANISARAFVGTGLDILVGGFVIQGSGTKEVLLRGIGPGLNDVFGFPGYMTNPTLTLLDANNNTLYTNTGWGGNPAIIAADTALGAFTLNPAHADSALLVSLPAAGASNYTAQVTGVNDTTGVALDEIYDADSQAPAVKLGNISARAFVGTGLQVLVGGFVIRGNTSATILIRAIGPGLADVFGFPGVLTQPVLQLFDANNNLITSNTVWGGNATIASVALSIGAFTLNPAHADSVLLVTLPPGNYTAQVSGVNSGTGVALGEIYYVP